jgi:hypothetical protein
MLGWLSLDFIEKLPDGSGWYSPLISYIDLSFSALPVLDWVIVGGETGKNARPLYPDWVRDIRDQCAAVNVPFLFKGWGKFAPCCESEWRTWRNDKTDQFYLVNQDGSYRRVHPDAAPHDEERSMLVVSRTDKDYRLLDGREHMEMPV